MCLLIKLLFCSCSCRTASVQQWQKASEAKSTTSRSLPRLLLSRINAHANKHTHTHSLSHTRSLSHTLSTHTHAHTRTLSTQMMISINVRFICNAFERLMKSFYSDKHNSYHATNTCTFENDETLNLVLFSHQKKGQPQCQA